MPHRHPPALPQLSIVLPCYNEAAGLESLLKRFEKVGRGVSYELILVDNGSTDETPQLIPRLLPHFPFATSVRIERNQGYGHGILTGLRAAVGDALAWSHADLQTDPADIFRAWQRYRQADRPRQTLVKGRRRGRALQERVVTWGMQTLATVLLRTRLHEINAQPKVFHRDLLNCLADPPIDLNFDLYVLYVAKQCGWRVETIPVDFPPRQFGESSWATTWRSKIRAMARSARYMLQLAASPKPRLESARPIAAHQAGRVAPRKSAA